MTKFYRFLRENESGKGAYLIIIVAILNIALLAAATALYSSYLTEYREGLLAENLGNIANLNRSAADRASALIMSWNTKLSDSILYAKSADLTKDEMLDMLVESNSSPERIFQLVGSDYTGVLAEKDEHGAFIPLSYTSASYEKLQDAIDDVSDMAFTDICFAPEFTDSDTGTKLFAMYKHVELADNGGNVEPYTLFIASRSSTIMRIINSQNDFENQSSVIVDSNGNYIIGSNDFKSTNLFQYFYVYNDLSMDEKNAVFDTFRSTGEGELYYKDYMNRDTVFRYSMMETNDWYCVTAVPAASFRTAAAGFNKAVWAVLALALLFLIDVAWQTYMNRRLQESVKREKEAGEAKTDFLSRMSHDIRTPLNGIIGLATLAGEENNPPVTKEYLDNITVSGNFLMGLVNDILDMSKVESGKIELHKEPYSGAELKRYAMAVILPLCKDKGIDFTINGAEGGRQVLLDRLRFNQILFNLLSNAVKYTNNGGLVQVDWQEEQRSESTMALTVSVSDNGIGMSEDFQRHMFDTFAQEHYVSSSQGIGLGLAIVNSLVSLMGGTIAVDSTQGDGTKITIRLEAELCPELSTEGESHGVVELAGRSILLCEDNAVNILFLRNLLEKWRINVDVAENGLIGLSKFSASAVNGYDAVLMDVQMPEMDGIEATKAIRALDRPDSASVPIIAITANAYDSDMEKCVAAGMNAHISKPVDISKLRELLSQHIK